VAASAGAAGLLSRRLVQLRLAKNLPVVLQLLVSAQHSTAATPLEDGLSAKDEAAPPMDGVAADCSAVSVAASELAVAMQRPRQAAQRAATKIISDGT